MDSNVGDSIREPHVVARMRLPLRTLTCSAGFSDMQTSSHLPQGGHANQIEVAVGVRVMELRLVVASFDARE